MRAKGVGRRGKIKELMNNPSMVEMSGNEKLLESRGFFKEETLECYYVKDETMKIEAPVSYDDLYEYSQGLALKCERGSPYFYFTTELRSRDQDNTGGVLVPLHCSDDGSRSSEELAEMNAIKLERDEPISEPTSEAASVLGQSFSHSGPVRSLDHRVPHMCNSCGSMFVSSITLSTHARTCKGNKHPRPYACKECGRKFSKRGLAKHKVTHSGKHSYACDICGNKFYLKGHLNKHLKLHKHSLFTYMWSAVLK